MEYKRMSKQKISSRNGVNVEQKKSVRQFFSLFHDFSYVFSGFDSSAFVVHSFHKQIAWCRRWPESFLFEYLHVHTATSRAINITTLSSCIVGTTVFFALCLSLSSFVSVGTHLCVIWFIVFEISNGSSFFL